jgi:hypothetical protein
LDTAAGVHRHSPPLRGSQAFPSSPRIRKRLTAGNGHFLAHSTREGGREWIGGGDVLGYVTDHQLLKKAPKVEWLMSM